MKKSFLIVTVVGAMLLTACGGSKTETTETTAADSTSLKTEIEADEAAVTEIDSLKSEIETAAEKLDKTLNEL